MRKMNTGEMRQVIGGNDYQFDVCNCGEAGVECQFGQSCVAGVCKGEVTVIIEVNEGTNWMNVPMTPC